MTKRKRVDKYQIEEADLATQYALRAAEVDEEWADEHIRQVCAEIQATWSEGEEQRRRIQETQRVEVTEFHDACKGCVFTSKEYGE